MVLMTIAAMNKRAVFRRLARRAERAAWRAWWRGRGFAADVRRACARSRGESMLCWAIGYAFVALVAGSVGMGGLILGAGPLKALVLLLVLATMTAAAGALCIVACMLEGGRRRGARKRP